MAYASLFIGDALEIMKTFENESIDMIMTSPPYWGLRDYGVHGQIGLEPSSDKYVQKLTDYFHELKRVLKKAGSFYINLGDTYMKKNLQMIPARIALALQKDGWILRNDVIWYKPNHLPASVKDRLTNTYEHLFHFVKSKKYFYDLDAIRVPHKSGPTSFNYRVREAKKGNVHIKGVRANLEEMKKYYNNGRKADIRSFEYITKFNKNSQIHNLLQNTAYARKILGRGHDTALNHPLGKNPGDVFNWKEEIKRKDRPLNPPQGVSLAGGNLGLKRRRLNNEGRPLYPPHHSFRGNGWEPRNPVIENHAFGKNPGDVIQNYGKYKNQKELRQDSNLGGKVGLAEYRDKCRASGIMEGNLNGRNPGDFWEITPKPFLGAHFAVYPEALCVRPIISSCPPDGIVLDPFAGSGTTMKVAYDLGRNSIGIELNPKYAEIIKRRVPTLLQVI
jgi:DNA modification methylase